jgi:hypothetical protein
MRTPLRYGFAIGLEIGPLPPAVAQSTDPAFVLLAGQNNVWELRFIPGHGLEWHMGDVVLTDPYFEPSRCNAITLTGYFEPKGYLAIRDPESQLKLYTSGLLRDANRGVAYSPANSDLVHNPTYVNFRGRAKFSNMMLSSFADSYSPRLRPQLLDFYNHLYRDQKLLIPDVKMMDAELCQ